MDSRELSNIFNTVNRVIAVVDAAESVSTNAAKAISGITDVTKKFAKGASEGLLNLARSYASLGNNIAATSSRLGIGTGALQELHFIAGRTGVSVNTIETAIQSFSGATGRAIEGVGKSSQAFSQLGVSLKNSDGSIRATENVLFDTLAALEKIEDPIQRDAAALKVFGESSTEMLRAIDSGAGGVEKLRKEANDLGVVIKGDAVKATEEFTNKSFGLGAAFTGLRNRIGVHLLPVLTPFIDKLTDLAKKIGPDVSDWARRFDKDLPGVLQLLWSGFEKVISVLKVASDVLRWVDDTFGLVNASIAVFAGSIIFQVVKAITLLTMAFKGLGVAISLTGIGLIIITIAALSAAILWVIRNWDSLKIAAAIAIFGISQALNHLSEFWETVKESISSGVSVLIDKFLSMADSIVEALKFIGSVNPFVLIAEGINWVIKALTGFDVLGKISETLQNLLPNWAINLLGLDEVSAPVKAAIPNARSEVGGTIRVQIDSEGRAKVMGLESQNKDVPVEVDVGTAMRSSYVG